MWVKRKLHKNSQKKNTCISSGSEGSIKEFIQRMTLPLGSENIRTGSNLRAHLISTCSFMEKEAGGPSGTMAPLKLPGLLAGIRI